MCTLYYPAQQGRQAELCRTLAARILSILRNPETAEKYGITSIPAMFVFEKGQVVKRVIGAKPKPALEADLAEFLA